MKTSEDIMQELCEAAGIEEIALFKSFQISSKVWQEVGDSIIEVIEAKINSLIKTTNQVAKLAGHAEHAWYKTKTEDLVRKRAQALRAAMEKIFNAQEGLSEAVALLNKAAKAR